MKTLFSKHKWMQLVYGALLLVAGILIIVFSLNQPETMSRWLSIILAITLFIYASALLFTGVFSLKEKYFDIAFFYSAVFIASGVVLLINTSLLGQFIVIFAATILCVSGVISVGQATAMVFFKRRLFAVISFYISGALLIAAGVLCFCFQEEVGQFIYIATGASVIAFALVEIYLGIRGLILLKKVEKAVDNKINEVEEEIKQIEEEKEVVNVSEDTSEEHHDA